MNLYSFGFILVWILWGIYTSYLMYLAMGFPKSIQKLICLTRGNIAVWKLHKDTPRKVYSWFLRVHKVCYTLAGISIYLIFIMPSVAVVIIFVSLYFGVLGRDCAEICAQRISATIGYLKYETPPENVCALCDHRLRAAMEMMMEGRTKVEKTEEEVVKLECGHEFHSRCILGWALVGKRDTCPFCKEIVNLGDILPEGGKWAWNSPRLNFCWIKCLIVMRYILVWNPLICYTALYFLKVFHFEPILDSHGDPLY